jgi:Protein of unknown function (DUF3616)
MDSRVSVALLLFLALIAVVLVRGSELFQGPETLEGPAAIQKRNPVQKNVPLPQNEPFVRYSGTCDASAAIALDPDRFLVADDEHNTLAVYATGRPGGPLATIPWNEPLGIDPEKDEHPEADIEGAARIGDRVYWITSHGRNKSGKWRANRHQFFALDLAMEDGRYTATPVEKPYRDLAVQLASALQRYDTDLHQAVQQSLQPHDDNVDELAPKEEGLNIEALAVMPDGKSLLVGFRNPRPQGKALLVPFLNPDDVLLAGAPPKFGPPILLDLSASIGGKTRELGIRSLLYSADAGRYLIVGGPHDNAKEFALFDWSGEPEDPPQVLQTATAAIGRIDDFAPEAAFLHSEGDRLHLLSDDGSILVPVQSPLECKEGEFKNGQCEMKHLRDDTRKTFRGLTVPVM